MVDASFAVHPDFKSRTGSTMSLRKGSIIDFCRKKKVNTDSLTTVALVGVSDAIHCMEWMDLFTQAQYYTYTSRLHQDNEVSQRLEINGKRSSSLSMYNLNIKYLFITDQM